mmetsp:Transcript_113303/g.353199  ORF Transcript_113303/g.353199 Transcript_113303/m.353199 type:complete len:947 (+) Transcript_113303:106-2946(+)
MLVSPFSQPWLYGALLSVVAAGLGVAGVILLKIGQHQAAGKAAMALEDDCSGGAKRPVRWCMLLRSWTWWNGLMLVIGHHPLNLYALTFAPETTIVPLGAVQVAVGVVLAYALLNERFTKSDVGAIVACILGMVVAISSMPHSMPGYVEDFPTTTLLSFYNDVDSNLGFALYCLFWAILLSVCIYASLSVSLTGDLKPFVLPMLVGLFNSQLHFSTKLLTTLVLHPDQQPQPMQQYMSFVALATALLAVAAVGTTCEGVRQLDCRFFVAAAFASTSVMVALEDVLFFREWQHMTGFDLLCFACGCAATVVGAVMVSPSHNRSMSVGSGRATPLLAVDEEPLQQYQGLLRIMEEHKIIRPRTGSARPLEVISLDTPQKGPWALLRSLWRLVPIASCLGVLLMCAVLYERNHQFVIFAVLTLWGVHNAWKYGLHMALFSYVGQRKMARYEQSDFLALHQLQVQQEASQGLPEPEGPRWEDVFHFVLLPNYKEEIDVLRLAIKSVAASQIAAKQICLVLAMEIREAGAEAKATQLREELSGEFAGMLTTFHPPDIPGETASKSSNVKWAAAQVLGHEVKKAGLDLTNVVITVADADSEFHPHYFEALTYQFMRAGCGESETADRYLSIWQPPIIHYKNYHTQPALVRLASLFTSQHELANLADPNAMKVPYSTYSISATLAEAVSGWDPDWISEDWHMGIKCFLATAGRVRVQPIFLGVLNYAPEGSTYGETINARWVQAKRHALGFSEIVFFLDHFPRVLLSIQGRRRRAIFVWRAFFLWSRCLLIHLTMATLLAIGPIAALVIAYFLRHQLLEDVNSWTFLTYCVFQSAGSCSMVLFFFTNVLLYELTRSRIDGCGQPWLGKVMQHRWLHFIFIMVTSIALMPFFFIAGGMAEWIAAIKTASTHKFAHDVAIKPTLSQKALEPGEDEGEEAPTDGRHDPKTVASLSA